MEDRRRPLACYRMRCTKFHCEKSVDRLDIVFLSARSTPPLRLGGIPSLQFSDFGAIDQSRNCCRIGDMASADLLNIGMGGGGADWADEADGIDSGNPIPPREVIEGPDGVKTITEYGVSDEGYLQKTIRVVKLSEITRSVSKTVAARKHWKKFGDCAGKPEGVERGISTVSVDEIHMEWIEHATDDADEEEEADYASMAAKDIQGMLRMERFKRRQEERRHGVANWAQLMALEASQRNPGEAPPPGMEPVAGAGAAPGGKYVPPSRRGGAGATMGESMYGRDDSTTVRVSNLSKGTTEADLEELCMPFGETRRIFLSRDRDTNESKGFAFVTFRSQGDAAKCIEKLNGYGYDHLILSVEWSKPREPREGDAVRRN
jgi:translation initiation factor 3 subunit G